MVEQKQGDALQCDGILCHQVNYEGAMAGGIARDIKQQLLPQAEYEEYMRRCQVGGKANLGTVLWSRTAPGSAPQYVANCFSQFAFESPIVDREDGSLTAYTAMRRCLEEVERFARQKRLAVTIPGGMGCGIAGGDWSRVLKIIDDIFNMRQSPVHCTICFKD